MEYIPYVGFATSNRATVMIHLCLYKKKKKKSSSQHATQRDYINCFFWVHVANGSMTEVDKKHKEQL
jgi:hypothetical protein